MLAGTLGLDNISRGPAHNFQSAHCGSGQILIKAGGVPCTGSQQDFGWPVKAHTKYTDMHGLDGQFTNAYQYVCYHGCSRSLISYNGLILAGLFLGVYGGYAFAANRQLDRQLRDLKQYQ